MCCVSHRCRPCGKRDPAIMVCWGRGRCAIMMVMTTAENQPTSASETEKPQHTLYELLDGEAGLRALVDRFYDLMDLEPQFAGIRAMHPSTLDGSRDKLFWFLSGWTGGPPL